MTHRLKTKKIKIANLTIGGGEHIAVQSMLNMPPHDIEGNISQALRLQEAGCEILRVAIPDMQSVKLIPALKAAVTMPIVADIHFDWRLALESASAGVDKIRINPGNIGAEDRVKAVADACRAKGIPIRIGVNSGSVESHILKKYGSATPQAMTESAFYHAGLLEKFDFTDIVLSMKTHNTIDMMKAYTIAAEKTSYPLHLGLTHTGTARMGLVKSAIAIGGLLADGIGDTIRVSLADIQEEEISAAQDILKAVGLAAKGPEIIACPTCGRACIDIINLTKDVDKALKKCNKPITVAVMGCVVNGPGEAKEADIGISGGGVSADGTVKCALFKKGEVFATMPRDQAIAVLFEEIEKL